MYLNFKLLSFILICISSIEISAQQKTKTIIYLIGDSTVADYTGNYDEGKDYMKVRYPIAGWGQEFQPYFVKDSLTSVPKFHQSNEIKIDDRARGGRSTRTFFQEGRWRSVYDSLQTDDWVLMQFGHNDAAENKTERYVPIEGYKEFLRLFVTQTRQKGAHPVILTPVARNYPWENDKLQNVHGEYPKAALEVATELNVPFIDLNEISMNFFSKKD
ncbi:rhamnogalacturonan acetylesterase [Moheibacter sediminis]|uniref:Lysophospholipase L1 n=1 Tax=Moheibacter sediminis TaxID=1434700 RepID=A0A1W2CXT3_9FLAO|nr:rhamnogalacturonan acetylesterase [Moheibacter sediminis]SMC90033.1 Lysophospholipase L1 [Moheibacter sediminis]